MKRDHDLTWGTITLAYSPLGVILLLGIERVIRLGFLSSAGMQRLPKSVCTGTLNRDTVFHLLRVLDGVGRLRRVKCRMAATLFSSALVADPYHSHQGGCARDSPH